MRPIFPNYSYQNGTYSYPSAGYLWGNSFYIGADVNNVNYLSINGGNSGQGVSLTVFGETNVSITYLARGTGNHNFNNTVMANSISATTGNVSVNTLGKGLIIKTGAGSRCGSATLVGGTLTLPNATITANSRVFLQMSTPSATPGMLTYSKSNGVSFTVNSSVGTDTSTFDYLIVELIP